MRCKLVSPERVLRTGFHDALWHHPAAHRYLDYPTMGRSWADRPFQRSKPLWKELRTVNLD
ncbi:MAG: hypothetical protein JO138_09240 [Acidobacteriaceae bacterium]|nr:hypothetical protein [Acidobacteriaceae bacterium]